MGRTNTALFLSPRGVFLMLLLHSTQKINKRHALGLGWPLEPGYHTLYNISILPRAARHKLKHHKHVFHAYDGHHSRVVRLLRRR